MGKNRPPKRVRDLLVDLERKRSELSHVPDSGDLVERLRRLIASAPQDYERFEAEAQELLQSCVDSSRSPPEGPSDAAPVENGSQSIPTSEGAWRSVCEIRTKMHAERRQAEPQDAASGGCRNHAQTKPPSRARRSGQVPIVPKVSLAFADAASASRKPHLSPALPSRISAGSAVAPAPQHPSGGAVLWIRPFDLRIYDNPGLMHVAGLGCSVHLVFAWSEEEDISQGRWRLGGTAASLWLQQALAALDADYQRWYGHRISYIRGSSTVAALQHAVSETGASMVITSKAYDAAGRQAEEQVQRYMQAKGVAFQAFNSFLLNDVDHISVDMNERRGHFGTLVPFLFACNSQPSPSKPQGAPTELPTDGPDVIPGSTKLESLELCRLPLRQDGSLVDWGAAIIGEWDITESGAYAALRKFLAPAGGLSKYEAERHLADASAVARISPYLRYGMLSCRTMYWESMSAGAKDLSTTFWRRLVWRDLAYWQLRLFPSMSDDPIRDHYVGQKWNTDKGTLHLWCQGRTGYPIVDAGMRELWSTGWMAQNTRMVAAVFLVEYLNIHWVEGARWFHHTLVDADPAINPMMWQNAGKSGLDQWNFTMHPAEFGRRMDPTGSYVRRWVPELASLPARFIHCPWEAPERLQKHILQGAYPPRCVEDLEAAARTSRTAIRDQRARRRDRNDVGGYDTLVLPRGSSLAHDGRAVRLFTKQDYRLP